jgi:hypothetical protein
MSLRIDSVQDSLQLITINRRIPYNYNYNYNYMIEPARFLYG